MIRQKEIRVKVGETDQPITGFAGAGLLPLGIKHIRVWLDSTRRQAELPDWRQDRGIESCITVSRDISIQVLLKGVWQNKWVHIDLGRDSKAHKEYVRESAYEKSHILDRSGHEYRIILSASSDGRDIGE